MHTRTPPSDLMAGEIEKARGAGPFDTPAPQVGAEESSYIGRQNQRGVPRRVNCFAAVMLSSVQIRPLQPKFLLFQ